MPVFLTLLERQTKRFLQGRLSHAEQRAAEPNATANMDIGRVGTMLG